MRAALLVLLTTLTADAQPTVGIRLNPPFLMDESLRSIWTATITNLTAAPIDDLEYYFSAGGATLVMFPDGCANQVSSSKVRCTIDLPANGSRELSFVTRNNERFGHFSGVIEASAAGALRYDEAVFGRTFFVTTTADAGAGSLRQAIADINASCTDPQVPCVASFRIDEGRTEDGLFFINLLAPLPEIVAPDVFIDGGAQIRWTGNSLNRPLIVLDGGAAGEGSGLVFRNSSARVTDLSVSRFRGNGIESHAFFSMFLRNFLVLNESRGVVVDGGAGYVTDNVLSSNGRSGGFFWTSRWLFVLRNLADRNRASGLFFHKPAESRDFVEAYDNTIRENAHAGIGLSVTATGDFARNSFGNNGAGAIDVGLDGPTPTVTGYPGRGAVFGAPSIIAARFDGGVTTVTVRLAPPPASTVLFSRVSLYAGPGDAQELLATANAGAEVTFTIPRDLRGQNLRAAMVGSVIENVDDAMIATSELSEPWRAAVPAARTPALQSTLRICQFAR